MGDVAVNRLVCILESCSQILVRGKISGEKIAENEVIEKNLSRVFSKMKFISLIN